MHSKTGKQTQKTRSGHNQAETQSSAALQKNRQVLAGIWRKLKDETGSENVTFQVQIKTISNFAAHPGDHPDEVLGRGPGRIGMKTKSGNQRNGEQNKSRPTRATEQSEHASRGSSSRAYALERFL